MEDQTKTSSIITDDWDFPVLTEEDLEAAAALPIRKRHVEDSHSPPKARRRLPDSLFSSSRMKLCSNSQRSLLQVSRESPHEGLECRWGMEDSRVVLELKGLPFLWTGTALHLAPYEGIKFGGHILYSKTVEEVERAAEELLNFVEAKKNKEGQCILGLDIEWRPTFRKGVAPGKAAVMQICGDNNYCHVLHIIYSGIPKSLQCLLEGQNSIKVGVGIAGDSSKIFKDYNVSVQNVGDLSDMANRKLSGEPKKWSLSNLTEAVICKQLPKPNKIKLGNWEVDGLSKEQLNYAATDAYISWYLYQVLSNLPDPDDKRSVETDITPIDFV